MHFNTLNFNRIQLHVSVENERAIKAYEKVGFVKEGTTPAGNVF